MSGIVLEISWKILLNPLHFPKWIISIHSTLPLTTFVDVIVHIILFTDEIRTNAKFGWIAKDGEISLLHHFIYFESLNAMPGIIPFPAPLPFAPWLQTKKIFQKKKRKCSIKIVCVTLSHNVFTCVSVNCLHSFNCSINWSKSLSVALSSMFHALLFRRIYNFAD